MLTSTIVFAAMMATAQESEEKWESYTSKPLGYTVTRPEAQDQEATLPALGPFGMIHQTEIVRQPGGVQYWIILMESDSEIPKASEAKWFEYARKIAVDRSGTSAKVISDEPVKVGPASGRDFELKVERKGSPSTHLKGRTFVRGTMAYTALAISSFPGEDVNPAKAERFLKSFAPVERSGTIAARPGGGAGPAGGGPPPGFGFNIQTKKTVTRSGGPMIGGQPKGGGRWETLTFKEDGFTVQMPHRPESDEHEGAGGFQVHTVTCNAGPVDLVAVAVQGPSDVPEGQQSPALERLMAKAANKFSSGFWVSYNELMDLGPPVHGRKYEFQVELPSVGKVSGAARGYVKGNRVFIVMAVSRAKGSDVPPDGLKFLDSFALIGAGGALAKANPPLKKTGPSRTGARKAAIGPAKSWGEEVDPDGDVKIQKTPKGLTMVIPGTPHVLAPERDKMNAPRVVSPTDDDFVATVKVDGKFNPSDKSTVKGLSSRQAGGLILWKDASNYLVFQRRSSAGDEGQDSNAAVLEELVAGKKGVTHRQKAADGPISLRLEREGGKVTASYSLDGKTWKELKPVDTTWAEGEVLVGVIAVNTSTGPHSVTFNDYSLESK